MSKFLTLVIAISFVFSALLPVSCSNTETIKHKVSGQLLAQVELRKEQIAGPTADRLQLMNNMGMKVDNLEIQRIFIHLVQELNVSQIEELESISIVVYRDSWIPPVGAHPTGFVLADMPIDKLGTLTQKDYVVRLDTAEQMLEPQPSNQPQSE